MRENQKLVDDLMALGGNILGNLLGARHEVGAQARERMESLSQRLNLVSRSEFDAAFAMLSKARAIQEDLDERLMVIETKLNLSRTVKAKKSAKTRLPSVNQGNQKRRRAR